MKRIGEIIKKRGDSFSLYNFVYFVIFVVEKRFEEL